jgi:capsular exopolysaccharide synthesis family protein
MSRLYDALKEASRFRQGQNGDDRNGLWEAWGINGTEIPPLQPLTVAQTPSPDPQAVAVDDAGIVVDDAVVAPDVLAAAAPVPVIPDVPAVSANVHLDKNARLIPHAVDPIIVEHYRKLRSKILQIQEEGPFRTLLVTSANPQEGKTVTVLNLGLSFAMLTDFKVLVIDGDMRRGTLGNWLGVSSEQPGLSNLIDGSSQLEDVVLQSSAIPMHFMVRGNSKVSDMRASQLQSHFQKLSSQYDLILVDSPPVNLMADVQILAASCDAVLLITRAFKTTRKTLEKAMQDLAPFRLIGTILNAGMIPRKKGYYGYYGS